MGYNVTTKPLENDAFAPAFVKQLLHMKYTVNNKKSRDLLGMTYTIPVRQQLIDLVNGAAKFKLIPDKGIHVPASQ